MQIFAAVDLKDRNLVLKNAKEHYEGNVYDPGKGSLFVASEGETARDVALKIGLSKGSDGPRTSGVVLTIANYWGHYDPGLWEWLDANR